jgi:hypothetical protein
MDKGEPRKEKDVVDEELEGTQVPGDASQSGFARHTALRGFVGVLLGIASYLLGSLGLTLVIGFSFMFLGRGPLDVLEFFVGGMIIVAVLFIGGLPLLQCVARIPGYLVGMALVATDRRAKKRRGKDLNVSLISWLAVAITVAGISLPQAITIAGIWLPRTVLFTATQGLVDSTLGLMGFSEYLVARYAWIPFTGIGVFLNPVTAYFVARALAVGEDLPPAIWMPSPESLQ